MCLILELSITANKDSVPIGDIDDFVAMQDNDQEHEISGEQDFEDDYAVGTNAEVAESQHDEPHGRDHTPDPEPRRPSGKSPLGSSTDTGLYTTPGYSRSHAAIEIPSSVVREFKDEDRTPTASHKRKSAIEEFLESGREKTARTSRAGSL